MSTPLPSPPSDSGVPQLMLIAQLRRLIPAHLNIADEIAETLGISTDSAYRRMRNEKEMTLGESVALAARYGLRLDGLLPQTQGDTTFRGRTIAEGSFDFADYFRSVHEQLSFMARHPEPFLIYAAKDMPFFVHFHSAELGAFKFFVWEKTLLNFKSRRTQKFSFEAVPREHVALGQQALAAYLRVPSMEIWNDETFNTSLRQIAFYYEAGLFEEPGIALLLLDENRKLLRHIEAQAEEGLKFAMGKLPDASSTKFELYNNEIVVCDNTVLAVLGEQKRAYLTHNVLNWLATDEPVFCDSTHDYLVNLAKRSTLISSVSEKPRKEFFNRMYKRLDELATKVDS